MAAGGPRNTPARSQRRTRRGVVTLLGMARWLSRRRHREPPAAEVETSRPDDASEPDPSAELRAHPGWWARLAGEALDLRTLAETEGLPGVEVRTFDGRSYLRADEFQSASSEQSANVERRATEIIRVLNGAARVEHGAHREVGVDAAMKVHEDGQIQNFVNLAASIRPRSRLTATLTVGDQEAHVPSPPSRIARAVELGLHNEDAERALRIFGRDDLDYRDLYHVFEIAESALGSRMFEDETVTRADVDRFTHTAQSPAALGDQARHGKERKQPPASPMSFDMPEHLSAASCGCGSPDRARRQRASFARSDHRSARHLRDRRSFRSRARRTGQRSVLAVHGFRAGAARSALRSDSFPR